MAGLMSKVARVARSPRGRKRAKGPSADPKKRGKIEQLRGRISRKGR